MALWTEKYKPRSINEIMDQKKAKDEILAFLRDFKPGRAMLFYGPAGVGKTLIAEVIAKERGWQLIMLNASDSRNKKDIESILGDAVKSRPLFSKGMLIVIDEIDGIAGREDMGGVGAIVNIIKESRYPVILIANDPWNSRLRGLRNYCKLVKFTKVPVYDIARRLKEICAREGIEVEEGLIKALARWSNGDMRSAIIDLQTIGEGKSKITQDDLSILGYREREQDIFNALVAIFNSGSIMASKIAMDNCDRDVDEIFWWVENNITRQFRSKEKIARAFDILSKADIFRNMVSKQQNWRFKLYMADLIASITLLGKDSHSGFIKFEPPKKIVMMGATKSMRADIRDIYARIGEHVHSSTGVVRKYYAPYLRLFTKEGKKTQYRGIEISKEEAKALSI